MELIKHKRSLAAYLTRPCPKCGEQMLMVKGAAACPNCGATRIPGSKRLKAFKKYSLRHKEKYESEIAHRKMERMHRLDEAGLTKPVEVGFGRNYTPFSKGKKRSFPNLF